ncbi:MAG: sugar ABC transporter ATP-binding protein [Dermatophilaceae bacterium]
MTVTAPDEVLHVSGLSKAFGATKALDGAELGLRRGTVHALLGGNGSGKSTAIKILAGVYDADAGAIRIGLREWDAQEYSARVGRGAGLRFVHQDLGLFDDLSVAENFALDAGWPQGRAGRIRWRDLYRRVATLLERFEIPADPRTPAGQLRPAQRAMVAIARALQDVPEDSDEDHGILVLDEPTATLPQHESEVLMQAVRRRADLGQTVLMVSHRMQEILSVAHDVTVFRDGRSVTTLVDASPTEDEVIALMTGKALATTLEAHTPAPVGVTAPGAAPVLTVRDLASGPLQAATLSVNAGEIVGVTGLGGSGRTSLLKTLFGEHSPRSGEIVIDGRRQSGKEDVKDRMALGVAYLPEDRVGESVFMDLTLRENLSCSVLRRYWGLSGMSRRGERAAADRLVRDYSIKTHSAEAVMTELSGGNQQKAIVARWLQRDPRLLLLDEPTQGVDVMSRKDIYETVRKAAARGCAVLVSSSDFIELCALCDRVLVLRQGKVAVQLRGELLEPDNLVAATQSSTPSASQPSATPATWSDTSTGATQ